MSKKIIMIIFIILLIIIGVCIYFFSKSKITDNILDTENQNKNQIENGGVTMNEIGNIQDNQTSVKNSSSEKLLGGLTPEDALEYMKENYEDLVIVEVNTDYWKLKNGFTGAMHIPHDEMLDRYNEIPKNKKVILHCGAGVVSVEAYDILKEKRTDIPQLSYIAGTPPVQAFNEWLEGQR